MFVWSGEELAIEEILTDAAIPPWMRKRTDSKQEQSLPLVPSWMDGDTQ